MLPTHLSVPTTYCLLNNLPGHFQVQYSAEEISCHCYSYYCCWQTIPHHRQQEAQPKIYFKCYDYRLGHKSILFFLLRRRLSSPPRHATKSLLTMSIFCLHPCYCYSWFPISSSLFATLNGPVDSKPKSFHFDVGWMDGRPHGYGADAGSVFNKVWSTVR